MTDQTTNGLVFVGENGSVTVQLDSPENTVWATVVDIAAILGCTPRNIEQHIANLYREEELNEIGTTKIFFVVRDEGGRQVKRPINHYNLDVILSVGYRVSSKVATAFRRWATERLKEYLIQGYAINEERIANDPQAMKALARKLRSIRLSESSMYKKVCDVFSSTASDYDGSSKEARSFFAMAQDKFHFAVTGKTAAEIILERADAAKPNMGLLNISGGVPTIKDAEIGKNYLNEDELHALENISDQFLLFAESKAFRGQRMTMEELSFKINTLLTANDYQVLYKYDTYKRGKANEHVNRELARYKMRIKAERGPNALNEPPKRLR